MRGTANASVEGTYCGRAVYGVSNLSFEDRQQILAHRCRERPTPWAHLARRYAVNEIDLRNLFDGPANDDRPEPVAISATPATPRPRNLSADREAMFRRLWGSGVPKAEIAGQMALSHSQIDRIRVKLKLPIRQEGAKPNGWTKEESAYVLRHYVAAGIPAAIVARSLPGRTPWAIIGHAHRQGWSRAHHPVVHP